MLISCILLKTMRFFIFFIYPELIIFPVLLSFFSSASTPSIFNDLPTLVKGFLNMKCR